MTPNLVKSCAYPIRIFLASLLRQMAPFLCIIGKMSEEFFKNYCIILIGKISCLCLVTFLPTFSYSLENHASRTEGLELARERDTACANAWVRSFFFSSFFYRSSDILRRPQKLGQSSTYNLMLCTK